MKKFVGVLGAGRECSEKILNIAKDLGKQIALEGLVTCAGGVQGVFEAAFDGANSEGGLTVAIVAKLDTSTKTNSQLIIRSDSDSIKRAIIAESCEGAIVVGGWLGTINLLTQFISKKKPVIAIRESGGVASTYSDKFLINPDIGQVLGADTAKEAVSKLIQIISGK